MVSLQSQVPRLGRGLKPWPVRDNEIRVVQLTSRFYTGGTLGWLKIQHITFARPSKKKKTLCHLEHAPHLTRRCEYRLI